jgi:TetR/AcrR family transcriptional regulator
MGIAERKAREKRQRQESIIDAAEAVFIEKGYGAMTMELVAEKVELNKATIYLYFLNKNDLFHAVVDRGLTALLVALKPAVEKHETGLAKVLAFIDGYIVFCRARPHWCAAINHREETKRGASGKMARPSPFEAKTDETAAQVFALVMDAIRQGKSDATLRHDLEPAMATLLIWSHLVGTMQLIENKQEVIHSLLGIKREGILKGLMQHILHALKA